jgi:hypothetical protein
VPLEIEMDGVFSDEVTEEVAYQVNNGALIMGIHAIVDRQQYSQETTSSGKYLVKQAAVLFRGTDIPHPDVSDNVVLDGLEWNIDSYDPVGPNMAFVVNINRRERLSKSV